MKLFTFDVDGRRIRIIYRSNADQIFFEEYKDMKNILNNEIVSICKDCKISWKFSNLNIVFYGSYSFLDRFKAKKTRDYTVDSTRGYVVNINTWIPGAGILKKNDTIYISSDHFKIDMLNTAQQDFENRLSSFKSSIREILIHEITHLHHNIISDYSSISKAKQRLDSATVKSFPITTTAHMVNALYSMRRLCFELLQKVVKEGIAEYARRYFNNKLYFSSVEQIVYRHISCGEADAVAESFSAWFSGLDHYSTLETYAEKLKYLNKLDQICRKIHSELKDHVYDIGFCIIYSIIYLNKELDFEDIVKMNYIKIIRTHESCSLKKGYQPLISYSSGKGVIDYADLLDKLSKAYSREKGKS